MRLLALLLATMLPCGGSFTAIATADQSKIGDDKPREELPARIAGHPVLRETYEFVAAHQSSMRTVRCFCGCDEQGHHSIVDCFVTRRQAAAPEWNAHGAACGMCLAIAQDVKRAVAVKTGMREIEERIRKDYGPPSGK